MEMGLNPEISKKRTLATWAVPAYTPEHYHIITAC
jgi:hypothetical protein